LFEAFEQNERHATFVAQVIVLIMMTCVNILCVMTAGWASNAFVSEGVVLVGFLVTVEALYSSRLIKDMPAGDERKLYYRLAEWVVILVLLKIFTEARFGLGYLTQNVISWQKGFTENFFTFNYTVNLFIVLILWSNTTSFAFDLMRLEDSISYINSSVGLNEEERAPLRAVLRRRYLFLGVLVVFLAGIMRQSQFSMYGKVPSSESVVILVLAYFLFGLLLLSLVYFANLRAIWKYEKISIPKDLALRWALYCAVFLIGLVLVVSLLPTSYSVGLFAVIKFLVAWFLAILQFLFALLLAPLYLILQLIGLLFRNSPQTPVQLPKLEVEPPQEAQSTLPGWEIFKSIVFWVVLLVAIIFAFRQYIQSNRELAEVLGRLRVWRWLTTAWTWVKAQFRKAGHEVGIMVETGIRRLRNLFDVSGEQNRWQFINPRQLGPRQRVIFFYLTMLRRAGDSGLPRASWQTPKEYLDSLKTAIPEEESDISDLTESFMDARYSLREVTPERADIVRAIWSRLIGIFRSRKRS
jgi:hypothetical protein